MATRKQKHERAMAKRAAYFADLARSNAEALAKERAHRAQKQKQEIEDKHKTHTKKPNLDCPLCK